jgi:hypothetical protein
MSRLVSIGSKVEQIEGLLGTGDLNAWEHTFVTDIVARYKAAGSDSRVLTEKQVDVIDRIWRKHFV